MEFTKNQKLAIETTGADIVVSASAGSGKTAVLTERVVNLVQNHNINIDEILAITFTKAASANMKSKTAQKFEDEENIEQLIKLQNADIHTIDAFCLNTVKQYYYEIDGLKLGRLDNILSSYEAKTIKDQIFSEMTKDYKDLIVKYKYNVVKEQLSFLISILDKSDSPEEELRRWEEQYSASNLDELSEDYKKKICDFINSTIKDFNYNFSDLSNRLSELKDWVSNDVTATANKNINIDLENFKSLFFTKLEKFDMESYSKFWNELVRNIEKIQKKKTTKASFKKIGTEEYEYIDNLYKSLRSSLVEFFIKKFQYPERIEQDLKEHNKEILELIDFARNYYTEYNNRKEQLNVVEYNDVMRYAIDILRIPRINQEFREKYKQILVDEFQDTSELQDTLVNLLKNNDNLFIVGDIKQSIYGFRNAEPKIMKNYLRRAKDDKDLKHISLDTNFRSSKAVINFNNDFYERLMNVAEDGAFVREEDFAKSKDKATEGNVKIKEFKLGKKEEKVSIEDTVKFIIEDIQAKGLKRKDVAILVNKNEEVAKFSAELSKYNIPHYAESQTSFYYNEAVHTVINFLKLIANPNDSLAWTYVLNSSVFEFSFDKLAEIKLLREQSKLDIIRLLVSGEENLKIVNDCFEKIYKNYSGKDNYYEDGETKVRLALRYIKQLPLQQIVNEIYKINNFYMEKTNSKDRASLDALFNYSLESDYTIDSFIQFLEQSENLKVENGVSFGEDDDVIKIMTVHKSKGLEFNTVYFYAMKQVQDKDVYINYNKKFGLGVRLQKEDRSYGNFYMQINSIQNKLENISEELRNMYVATTRAEENLCIICKNLEEDDKGKKKEDKKKIINKFEFLSKTWRYYDYFISYNKEKDVINTSNWKKVEEVNVGNLAVQEETLGEILQIRDGVRPKIEMSEPSELSFTDRFTRGTKLHKATELLLRDNDVLEELTEDEKVLVNNLYNSDEFKKLLSKDNNFEVSIDCDGDLGTIDFLAIDEKRITVVDFKSNRGKEEDYYRKTYSKQLGKYRKALEKLYPNYEIETFVYSFDLNKFIDID